MNYVGTLLGLGIGLMFVGILVGILYYVAFSWSHMKALKALGYDKAWLAWIPFGVLFACSDAVTGDAGQVRMFNSFEVPAAVFKFWWIAQLALWVLSLSGPLATLINLALNITFYGCTYAKMYALLERKAEEETQVIGCVSGVIPLVAIVKFLTM